MSTTEAPTLQNRRLRLRNARTNPSTLPLSSSCYTHKGMVASPISRKSSFPEDNGWETEDQGGDKEEEGSSGGDDDNSDEADRKRRNRVSTSSLLSDGSTLIGGEMDDGDDQEGGEDEVKDTMGESGRRNSNGGSPSPLFSLVGPVRAMTNPIPVRPMSMISTPSPLSYASPTTHRRNRSNGGLGRGDSPGSSARYIDYLERQIADTVSQLQSYTSPSEGTSHAVKMRKLTAETRLLRSELTDWENKFSARVKEEVNARAAIDKSLRTKIKSLEAKLEEAEYRYKTAEVDLEEARATISDLKGVEEENRALEFRIEALSELLADSTRLAQSASVGGSGSSSAASSRPGSVVFPKRSSSLESSSSAPSPTTSLRTQLRYAAVVTTTGGKNTPVEGRSRRVSREGSTCALEDYGITDPIEAVLCSMSQLAETEEEGVEGEFRYPEEYEAELNPNTALIQTSPHPPPAILRNRRMRRFPSGSSAPKILILPSAAVVTATTTTTTTITSPTFPATSDTTSGIFAPFSRPPSSSSSSSSCCAPPPQLLKAATPQNSLFAELARAQDSSEDSEEEEEEDTEAELDEDNNVAAAASISEGLTNPTPLVVKTISKVGESFISPQGTFFRAKRKAMDILGGVVGNRVSRPYHHHHLLPSSKPPSSLSLSPRRPTRKVLNEKNQRNKSPPTTATTCAYCHCHQQPPSSTAITAPPKAVAQTRPRSTSAPLVLPQPVEEAVEHVWLWVRFVVALVVALGVAVREGPGVIVAVDGVGSIGGSAASSISSNSVGDAGGFDGVGEEERCFAIRKLQQQGAAASGRGVVESRGRRGRRGLGWGEDRVRVWERPGDR
ncbi:hypothetical protein B9Z19DRAFT_261411 [Tuber borchii]|uniref:Uncharacterized protein n=1 Tax=Tuber borchii TaxID=42251 RepID=A0A2T6ZLC4_TUBBO|nr:hypothetical protein B9Z19DRAFT_261411 [Tuber borchii]